jgi:hypothetical protein
LDAGYRSERTGGLSKCLLIFITNKGIGNSNNELPRVRDTNIKKVKSISSPNLPFSHTREQTTDANDLVIP